MKISIDEYISMQQDGQVLDEAFKAGNRARKKESARDTVGETDPLVDTLLNEINTEDLVRRYLEKNRFMTVHATFRDIILHVLGRLTNVERGVLNHCLQVYTYQQSGGEFGVIHFRTMGSFKTKLDDDRLVFEIKEDEPAKMVADFFERVSGGGSLLLHIDTHEAKLGESYVTAAGIGFCLKIVEMFNRFREGTDIYEAFKTGNRARKKESVRDTVDSVNVIDPETADHLLTGAIQEVNRWGYGDLFKVGSRLYITEFVRSLFGYATGSSAPGEYLQISSMELDDEGMSGDMWIKYWGTKQDTAYSAYSRRWMVSWHLEPDGSFIGFRLADFKGSTEDSWSTPLLVVYADGSFETGPGFMSFVNDFMTESARMYKAGMLVPQHPVDEAFRAGNKARKKEAVADTVQTVEPTITCKEAITKLAEFLKEPIRAPWDPCDRMSRCGDEDDLANAVEYAEPKDPDDLYNFDLGIYTESSSRGFAFDCDTKININIYEEYGKDADGKKDRSVKIQRVSIGSTGVGSDNGTFDLLKQGRSDSDIYIKPIELTPATFASLMELCHILFPLNGNDSRLSYFIGGGNGAERVQTYGQFLYANQKLLWPWLCEEDRMLVYEVEKNINQYEEMDEAFKAGNRARKKETAQDRATDSFSDDIRIQTDLFRRQTGIELEIIDGRPVHFGDLAIIDNRKVTALPDNLTVKDGGLCITGCPNIRELPHGMRIDMFLDLRGSNGIKSVPYDTAFMLQGFIINYSNMWEKPHNEELTKFFQKMKIWYGPDSGIRISDWKKWQMENGYGYLYDGLDEAFRAGNRARKKETVQDTVQEVGESVEDQVNRFEDETGIKLEIRDGRPYTSGPLNLNHFDTLTRLPNNLHVDYYCCISNCPNIEAVPHGLSTRTGALNADHCKNLRYVPNDIRINNTIYFNHCPSLESLPEGLKVYNGGIDLSYCTALKSLPENFEVNGPLKVTGCGNLKTLPKGLSIDCLECEHSGLTELPLDIRFKDTGLWAFLRPNMEVSRFFHKITGVAFNSDKQPLMKEIWCRWQQEHGYVDYGIDLSKPVDINEGGKAVKGVSPIRGDLALTVANKAASALMQQLPGVKIVPVGSVGKKPADQESGDIDLAVQVPWEQKDLVIQAVQKLVPDAECREFKALWLVSAPWPWREDGLYGRVQLDMFLGPDIRLTQFMRWSPNLAKGESRYKGLYRTALLISIASCIPAEGKQDVKFDGSDCLKDCWRYSLSPRTGLRIVHKTWASKTGKMLKNSKNVDEDTVIVAVDPQIIAVKLLGEGATLNDCVSLESVWKRMQSPQFPYRQYQDQILKEYYKYLQDAGEELPAMKQNEDNTDVKKD